jgi:phage terminase large subunit
VGFRYPEPDIRGLPLAETRWIEAEVPERLAFFLERGRWRYKIARGGRGSAKSRTIAAALIIGGVEGPLRWLCARETQKSLKYSSRQILVDTIERLGLSGQYEVMEDEIRGKRVYSDGRRTLFIFGGIREMSVDSIKSLEDFDGIWISEAHALSEESWKKITPTFRRDGAEIWVDYNPEFEEDFIHKWCNNPPPNARIEHVTFEDNPWFPDVLKGDMEHMKENDPEGYEHVWLGKARNSVIGAVYGKEMQAVQFGGRIVLAPGIGVDRTKPVDVFCDLGHGDPMALWFAQMVAGWVNIVDFYQNEGESIEHYVSVIRSKGFTVGTVWLPWDGVDAMLHHKLTGSNQRSPEMVLRSLGINVRVAPKTSIESGISAVRTLFPQMRFSEPTCHEGIRHLRMYQWGEKPDDGRVITKPKHDEHSHAADALKTLAVCIKEPAAPRKPAPQPVRRGAGFGWG